MSWYCGDGATATPPSPKPRTCSARQYLYARVTAPDCADGRKDSLDHRSHMTYAAWSDSRRYRVCPPSHPIPVPQVRLVVEYPPEPNGPLALSSGSQFSLHADFFDAWRKKSVERLISKCIARDVICGVRGVVSKR